MDTAALAYLGDERILEWMSDMTPQNLHKRCF